MVLQTWINSLFPLNHNRSSCGQSLQEQKMKNKSIRYVFFTLLAAIMTGVGYAQIKTWITPMAAYIPQIPEKSTTPVWINANVSCEGKPYNQWSSPGMYLYENGRGTLFTLSLGPEDTVPDFGVDVPESPSFSGTEELTTNFGTFQATKVSASGSYSIFTGRFDYVQGSYQRSEWYVCGYGLVKLISSDSGAKTPGSSSYSNSENLTLLSFTPLTTNEFHVRYILADIQLNRIARRYRAHVSNEETAEALRRWDAGVRVVNIDQFKRRNINGQWQVVDLETGKPASGMTITLNVNTQN